MDTYFSYQSQDTGLANMREFMGQRGEHFQLRVPWKIRVTESMKSEEVGKWQSQTTK